MSKNIYKSGEYFSKHPTWHAEDSPYKASQILKGIQRNNLRPKTICDIGCGAGEVISNLFLELSEDTNFFGYEISPQAYEVCKEKERERLNFLFMDFLSENSNTTYDLILAIDVFEHVENYMGFLRKLRSRGTNHIFHIPLDMNVLSVVRDHPIVHSRKEVGHLHYFSKNTALMTLKDCGYKIVDYFYTAGVLEKSGGSLKHRLFYIPRKTAFKINKDMAASFLGGFSLMVITENPH